MKIVALQAENIKKLVAVEIKPDGNLVQITGANGQGKTSILDAISWALEGQGVIQGEPIRKGQTKAWVKLDLGDMIVERTFKKTDTGETTSSISVKSKEGAKFPSPQAMIDKLIGRLAFDPLAFARMKPREQFDELKRLVPGLDFEKVEAQQKADFEARTNWNRKAKESKIAAEAIPVKLEGPIERIDEVALVRELEAAGNTNRETQERKGRREEVAKRIPIAREEAVKVFDSYESDAKKAIENGIADSKRARDQAKARHDELQAAALKALDEGNQESTRIIQNAETFASQARARAKTRHGELQAEADDLEAKLKAAGPLPEPIDLSAISKKIEDARKSNDEARAREDKINKLKEAADFEQKAKSLTDAMDAREADKQARIAAAKLPVDGLGFGDGIVMLNGVPFDQASHAEQLRTSIGIAMSLNPKLRVIRVADGSLMDERSLKLLADMAALNDFQVWIEKAETSGKIGFVIEDGKVKSTEAVPA